MQRISAVMPLSLVLFCATVMSVTASADEPVFSDWDNREMAIPGRRNWQIGNV